MFFERLVVVLGIIAAASGCSNIIVSPGASTDSSSMVAYNADSGTLYGSLYHYPAADHEVGTMRDVYDWDTGAYLGKIPEARHTYNVVGNINEKGLIIGETTYGGVEVLQHQSAAKIDYGSLIWITLQRAATAREAIETIGALMAEFGYASEGESFSIADQTEAWVMEIIGKGEYELGAVWVAQKLPDGAVCAHANQARITTFPLDDPENCLYSKDVISFAQQIGLYPTTASDEDFSFSDVYDAVTFSGARFCEARVWTFFGSLMGEEWAAQYEDYAQGYNLTNRMPLFVEPPSGKKVSLMDTMAYMRSHFEETSLDMLGEQFSDVGATTGNIFRAHPLTWSSSLNPDGSSSETANTYLNERPIATPQTGWNFVAQSRQWMPTALSGLIWFGVDDSGTTVRVPVYGSATKVPETFAGQGAQDGVTPPMMKFNMQSAFYVFNLVANWAYSRWDLIYPDIANAVDQWETTFISQVAEIDKEALVIATDKSMDDAIQHVTDFSVKAGNALVTRWGEFFGELFVKYRDGYVVTPNPDSTACGCNAVSAGYPSAWYDRIVKDTGDHYYYPNEDAQLKQQTQAGTKVPADAKLRPVSKVGLLSRR